MNAKQYKQQRDELIAAVQRALGWLNDVTGDRDDYSELARINSAKLELERALKS